MAPAMSGRVAVDYLLMRRSALVPDSGGAGRWRGGLGFCREAEILQDGVPLTIYSEHFKLPVPGREGGLSGQTGSLTVRRRGRASGCPAP